MNLDRAFVLLFASIGAVSGFAPGLPTAFSMTSSSASRVAFLPTVCVASTAEAGEALEEVASEPAAAPAFETAIYVGNISFGKSSFSTEYTDKWVASPNSPEKLLCVNKNKNSATLESDLRSVFSAHGSVSKVQIPMDRATVSDWYH